MKIKPEDYAALQTAIGPLLEPHYLVHLEIIKQVGKAKDPAMRARWDILWASGFDVHSLSYLADSHIDTALQAIIDTALRAIIAKEDN